MEKEKGKEKEKRKKGLRNNGNEGNGKNEFKTEGKGTTNCWKGKGNESLSEGSRNVKDLEMKGFVKEKENRKKKEWNEKCKGK